MQFNIHCHKKPVQIEIVLRTASPERIMLKVFDKNKPNTYYTRRYKTINGVGKLIVKMPQSPKVATVQIYNTRFGNLPANKDKSFHVESINPQPLKRKKYKFQHRNPSAWKFLKFAQEFSENAGIYSAGWSVYKSDDGKYRIDYLDVIKDKKSGRPLKTPSRINAESGIIEVSKKHFQNYTVPMRMAILLHEYAHVFMNKVPADEVEADLNALWIYMAMGYPTIEAHQAFLYVFKTTPTGLNGQRYKKIKQFIDNFEKQDRKIAA